MRWVVLSLLLASCSAEREPPAPGPVAPAIPVAPAESLATRLAPGVEVWFVGGRNDQDSSGTACHERSLEIRDSAGRRGVPLLYTLAAPTRLSDSSFQARVFLHCQPGDTYRVSVRTGLPTLRAR